VAPDLTHELPERVVDVNTVLGRSLNELAVEVFGKITALYTRLEPRA
jgi:hypothetical protein